MKKIIGFVLIIVVFSGCKALSPQKTETSEKQTSRIRGPLLAKVNNWAIGVDDFRDQLKAVEALDPEIDIEASDTKIRFLQELVNLEILSQEAQRKGLGKDEEIQEAVRNFKRNLLTQKLLGEISKDVIVTETEIENFYNTNKERLKEPEERRIREIVVPTQTEAKNILIKLLEGESFSILARANSIAASQSKGGDLGYISVNLEEKFQKFWEVVFTTEEGEVSNYFRGPEGKYYILKVEDVKGGEVASLYEVKERIRELLRRQKIENKREDIIYNAKQKFEVEINEGLLR